MSTSPKGFDPRKSTSARVLNHLLGGKDAFGVDQKLADDMMSLAPDTKTMAWFSRQFLTGSARLAAQNGVRQFLDMGAGMPIEPTVHDTVQAIHPDGRVAYVDHDPVVVTHWEGLYSGIPGVAAILGDLCDPDAILDEAQERALVNFAEPVAVLLVGVLPFIADADDPAWIVSRLRDRMAPGSYIAITQSSLTSDPEFIRQVTAATSVSAHPIVWRSAEQVSEFLAGFEVLEPGVTTIQDWLAPDLPQTGLVTYGVIGRKPGSS
ncbi:SAM-dependent methyltransferase [Nocardia huaxiensis]|uniref:SAM-dependent methyltransferase n=1 Tax=Nocardia huaxiensis TaxID=2755382 RepID=A0A7D6Z276_9NOCA|nr:SAM-dependent methyltransferase [Nocardia huaxiensis]QLY28964.1 SAM-dependent methyltransferase [Nocardia huaxiensis]